MMTPKTPIARRARWASILATAVVAVFALVLAGEAAMLARQGDPRAAAGQLAFRLPLIVDLWAAWTLRCAFASLARGALFDRVVPRLLRQLGGALALGGATSVVLAPLAQRAVAGTARGAYLAFDPAAITLGVVGLLLVLLARLFSRAGRMRVELDEII